MPPTDDERGELLRGRDGLLVQKCRIEEKMSATGRGMIGHSARAAYKAQLEIADAQIAEIDAKLHADRGPPRSPWGDTITLFLK